MQLIQPQYNTVQQLYAGPPGQASAVPRRFESLGASLHIKASTREANSSVKPRPPLVCSQLSAFISPFKLAQDVSPFKLCSMDPQTQTFFTCSPRRAEGWHCQKCNALVQGTPPRHHYRAVHQPTAFIRLPGSASKVRVDRDPHTGRFRCPRIGCSVALELATDTQVRLALLRALESLY